MYICLAVFGLLVFLANLIVPIGRGIGWVLEHVCSPIVKFVLGPATIVTIVLFVVGMIIAGCRG